MAYLREGGRFLHTPGTCITSLSAHRHTPTIQTRFDGPPRARAAYSWDRTPSKGMMPPQFTEKLRKHFLKTPKTRRSGNTERLKTCYRDDSY